VLGYCFDYVSWIAASAFWDLGIFNIDR